MNDLEEEEKERIVGRGRTKSIHIHSAIPQPDCLNRNYWLPKLCNYYNLIANSKSCTPDT